MKSTDVGNLIGDYQAGVSCGGISRKFHVTGKRIRSILVEHGIVPRTRKEAATLACTKTLSVDSVEIARRYIAGASCDELGLEFGVKGDTIRRRLVQCGVTLRGKTEATKLAKTKKLPSDLIERYRAGESLLSLSKAYGISRGGIFRTGLKKGRTFGLMRMLIEAGVPIRDSFAAQSLSASRMTDTQRAHIARKAHKVRCSPDEIVMIRALNNCGLGVEHQTEVGPYNVDLTIHGLPIAVELQRVWPLSSKVVARYRKRLKGILDCSYVVLYVIGRLVDATAVAQQIVALTQELSRTKTFRGSYRVIRGDGQPCPKSCTDFDGLPVI